VATGVFTHIASFSIVVVSKKRFVNVRRSRERVRERERERERGKGEVRAPAAGDDEQKPMREKEFIPRERGAIAPTCPRADDKLSL